MLKLTFDLASSSNQWACHIRARFIKHKVPILHYVKSSIWLGLKPYVQTVLDFSVWCIGDGVSINFWLDKWLPNRIVDMLEIPADMHRFLTANVKDFIVDNC